MVHTPTSKKPTDWDDYRFDLQGSLILENAVDLDLIEQINQKIDYFVKQAETGEEWVGNVHCEGIHRTSDHSFRFWNVVEGGTCFEELIDHPNWIDYIKRYVDYDDDKTHLWMNFAPIIRQGNCMSLHAGGHTKTYRSSFIYHDNDFHCGNMNIILALNDIGPGDGGTLVVPGSHKSNLANPLIFGPEGDRTEYATEPGPMKPYLKEVHLKAGDALLFTDALTHGASLRTNEGERRTIIYRYSSFWTKNRLGYEPSEELVARLTPERRAIVRPVEPQRPPTPDCRR